MLTIFILLELAVIGNRTTKQGKISHLPNRILQ